MNNPKTPLPVALKLVERVGAGELRRVVRLRRLRKPIIEAARRRLRILAP
jgi:hypothetical protein